ncbi:hypothetical protein SKAU_G00041330 [Synaphobranchus kaupii]|uniref:Uncharacterized protein n=1 Tax=Synaphobranchus kaupii TaxID=118154 RepID=A0A9Q1G142_SYNKA|nr:hypothetical protein SKAU_G00041330 [Synaphobranchus kaupii]
MASSRLMEPAGETTAGHRLIPRAGKLNLSTGKKKDRNVAGTRRSPERSQITQEPQRQTEVIAVAVPPSSAARRPVGGKIHDGGLATRAVLVNRDASVSDRPRPLKQEAGSRDHASQAYGSVRQPFGS